MLEISCTRLNRLVQNSRFLLQIWSGKWCIKDEPKVSDLVSAAATAVTAVSTPPHNNNNNNNNSSYYDTHNVFPTVVSSNNTDTILYDSITTISQAQNTLYAPSIGTAIGEYSFFHYCNLKPLLLNLVWWKIKKKRLKKF